MRKRSPAHAVAERVHEDSSTSIRTSLAGVERGPRVLRWKTGVEEWKRTAFAGRLISQLAKEESLEGCIAEYTGSGKTLCLAIMVEGAKLRPNSNDIATIERVAAQLLLVEEYRGLATMVSPPSSK